MILILDLQEAALTVESELHRQLDLAREKADEKLRGVLPEAIGEIQEGLWDKRLLSEVVNEALVGAIRSVGDEL